MLPHPSLGRVWLARGDPGIPLCTAPICQFLVGLSSNVVVCSKFALPWVQEVRNHRVYQHKLCFDEVIAAVAVTLLLVQQHLIKTKVTTLDRTMVVKWVLSGYYRLEAQHLLAWFMMPCYCCKAFSSWLPSESRHNKHVLDFLLFFKTVQTMM